MSKQEQIQPESATGRLPQRKRQVLLVLAGALVLLFLLSIGITGLPLAPGEAFAIPFPTIVQPSMQGDLGGGEVLTLIVRVLLAIALVTFPITLVWSILTKEGRKRLLMNLVLILMLWLALNLRRRALRNPAEEGAATGGAEQPVDELLPATPLPEFIANPPDWTVVAVTLAVSLLLVGLAAGAVWLIWRQRRREPLTRLGQEAQAAIEALQTGGDVKSTVIRCYREMSRVLQQERGIQRGVAMTPSEFEQALRGKGLPHDAVHQLTHLFEDVRYGAKQTGEREERLAIESLSVIVASCRKQNAQ